MRPVLHSSTKRVIVRRADAYSYGTPVHKLVVMMETVSVNKFRDNLKQLVEQCVNRHEPLRVLRRSGQDFVVMSAEDWEREQETLYILQNSSLMRQQDKKLHQATRNIIFALGGHYDER